MCAPPHVFVAVCAGWETLREHHRESRPAQTLKDPHKLGIAAGVQTKVMVPVLAPPLNHHKLFIVWINFYSLFRCPLNPEGWEGGLLLTACKL